MNEQPWLFIVVSSEDKERFNDLLDILEESNRLWARSAYALIVSLARKNFTYKNRFNKYAVHDTGMAVGNMLIQAASMDIYIHQMGGYDEGRLRSYFDLGEDIEALAVMAMGYLGDGSELSGDLLRRHSVRKTKKDMREYAFRNNLNNPAFGD
jgi:nitroreductase